MSEDKDLFAEAMSGVEPIKHEARVQRQVPEVSDTSLRERRAAAVSHGKVDDNYLVSEGIEPLDHYYVLEFKRPGIQNGVFRKLKQGKYEAEATLDLHRMTVEQARREVFSFISEAVNYGLRSLLIVHGKGSHAGKSVGTGVLKAYVNHWLKDIPQVQAFHSASKQHGSTGAVYVLLSKGEEQKKKNRLKYNKGRET